MVDISALFDHGVEMIVLCKWVKQKLDKLDLKVPQALGSSWDDEFLN